MGASPESRKTGNPDVSGFRVRRFAASRNDRREFFSSLLDLEPDPEATPMAAIDRDRGRDILHQDEFASAHIAAIGLQQELPLIAPGRKPGPVVEYPAVAAVGGIPDRVGSLRP